MTYHSKPMEFTKNQYSVRIKKCCASCKHHTNFPTPEGVDDRRYCTFNEKKKMVFKDELCRRWEMGDLHKDFDPFHLKKS